MTQRYVIRKLTTRPETYRAGEVALFHRLECFRDCVPDFDAAFFEFLGRSP
jgi:hypothetical protein